MQSVAPIPASSRCWPEALRLIAGVWGLGFVLMLVGGLSDPDLFSPAEAVRWAVLSALGAALCAAAWRLAVALPDMRAPRTAVLAAALLGAAAAHAGADLATGAVMSQFAHGVGRITVVSDSPLTALALRLTIKTNVVLYLALYGFFGMAATALISSIEARERDRRLGDALAAAGRAQLAALRFQLNPHFLFNTLNAIGSLAVVGRTREAEALVGKLSDFLRASLATDAEAFVPLEHELAVIRTYLDIEGERFRDRMTVAWDCPPDLGRALVPSFLLQPLAENAVKHAVGPALRPTTLRLSARRQGEELVLAVEDDGAGAAAAPLSLGVGLTSVRDRLGLLYGARGGLEAGPRGQGFAAVVRLPLAWAERAAA